MRSTGEGGAWEVGGQGNPSHVKFGSHLLYGNSAQRRLLPRVSLAIAADSSHGTTTVGALHA